MRQVWRAYDTVELENGEKFRINNICFPTRSVRVVINEVPEWIPCEQIVSHLSATAETDDIMIINELHTRLMAANKRNDDLQELLNKHKQTPTDKLTETRRRMAELINALNIKKKYIERIESAVLKMEEMISGEEEQP